ncbi:MAG: heavy metal translocating P-type ATPase [Burkholderiales bacterium]
MIAPPVCFHCGLPVLEPDRFVAVVDGRSRQFCCAGCQAVAETILGSGLAAFYRSRSERAAPRGSVEAASAAELSVYDSPDVQATFVEVAPDGALEATLLLEGITCAACIWLNEQHLAQQPGVIRADVNFATRRARVRWDPARTKLSAILEAIQQIGYRAWPHTSAIAERVERAERRTAMWRLFVAAFGMMQVMMYAYPAYIAGDGEMSADIASLLRWASLVLTIPVMLYSAAPFFAGARRDLRLGRLGMDVPVALGIAAAFAGSAWATWTGRGEVYFDSLCMFVFFLLAGRWLERAAREKAAEALRHLVRALPAKAQRLTRYPEDPVRIETVPAAGLRPGDHVLVRPGDAFPADGAVVSGESRVDESLLTGESYPVARSSGDAVAAGTANVSQPLVVRVDRIGAETRLGSIVRLVERAHGQRPRLVEMADRYAGRFVAAVLLIGAVSALAWMWVDPSRALMVSVAVLVVTCPCALSLAMPAALTVGTGALARVGLIVTRERAIETLTRVTHVVMDKTGTLTEGRLSVLGIRIVGDESEARIRAVAAALERSSDHPVARALRGDDSMSVPAATRLHHVAGAGIEAMVDGRRYRIGARAFCEALCGSAPVADSLADATEVWLAREDGMLAVIELGDRLRADAADVVTTLRAQGIAVLLASGDREAAVRSVATRCGIDRWEAGCTPERKHSLVESLQQAGAVVCMIGDGVNDAPVIARADVSIAMGSGAVLAQQCADYVLTRDRLDVIGAGLAVTRRTMHVVKQNLAWALLYNVVAVPLAAFGWITPWAAGLGMAASSLLVVLNALRLRAAGDAALSRGHTDVTRYPVHA